MPLITSNIAEVNEKQKHKHNHKQSCRITAGTGTAGTGTAGIGIGTSISINIHTQKQKHPNNKAADACLGFSSICSGGTSQSKATAASDSASSAIYGGKAEK
jgi:hypothetical protein